MKKLLFLLVALAAGKLLLPNPTWGRRTVLVHGTAPVPVVRKSHGAATAPKHVSAVRPSPCSAALAR